MFGTLCARRLSVSMVGSIAPRADSLCPCRDCSTQKLGRDTRVVDDPVELRAKSVATFHHVVGIAEIGACCWDRPVCVPLADKPLWMQDV